MSEEYLREWIRKAEEDYVAATVRQRKRRTPTAAAFHCQQWAEKHRKAFLVQRSIVFPRTHGLLELHKLCVSDELAFELIGDWLDLLNPYAVEYRYPGEEATLEEGRAAVKVMKRVRPFVRGQLGLVGD